MTDNGSSFLAKRFQTYVRNPYAHGRIRYRTPTQLGRLERFHRTFKDEEVYGHVYDSPAHARDGMAVFRTRHNEYRPHWALVPAEGSDPLTPHDVYVSGCTTKIPKWPGWAKGAKQRLDALMGQTAVPETRAS